jgi:hypothetical protein
MGFYTQMVPLMVAQGDGNAVGNTTTATSLLTGSAAHAKTPLWADFWNRPGKMIRVTATGRVSNIVTTPGTLTMDLRLGATVVFNGGAMALNTTAKTNVSWKAQILLTQRAVGTAATLMGGGEWASESVVGAASGVAGQISLPASAPAVGSTFDATTALQLDLFAAWSIANAGNTLQLHQFLVEEVN